MSPIPPRLARCRKTTPSMPFSTDEVRDSPSDPQLARNVAGSSVAKTSTPTFSFFMGQLLFTTVPKAHARPDERPMNSAMLIFPYTAWSGGCEPQVRVGGHG